MLVGNKRYSELNSEQKKVIVSGFMSLPETTTTVHLKLTAVDPVIYMEGDLARFVSSNSINEVLEAFKI